MTGRTDGPVGCGTGPHGADSAVDRLVHVRLDPTFAAVARTPVVALLTILGILTADWLLFDRARVMVATAKESEGWHADQPQELDAARDDDTHWRGGLLYVNRDDPQLLVPRRFGVGWTLNFAHPVASHTRSPGWLIALVAAPIVSAILSAYLR
jgi:uncharacterized membrane protein